jgi:[ribosomal protein S5]-alanine N-acetyltransferase
MSPAPSDGEAGSRRIVARTARLILRELTPDDLDPLFEVLGDPIAMEHYPAPKTREETAGWIAWARASYERNGFGLWAIERAADGAFIGDCGPMLQPVDDDVVPEIGYHVVRREWNNGFATEAAIACRELVLGELGFERVVSIVAPENLASRRVAEKVHDSMREVFWQKSGRAMCLYETRRPGASAQGTIVRSAGSERM